MARPSLLRGLCALSVFSQPILGHMQMSDPSPLRDPHSNGTNEPKDYNILMPLKADGSDFTCKGYQWNTPLTPVATYDAGETYTMKLMGGATHGGGSCQISLSCNQGVDFKVIKSIIGGCPEEKEYGFTIPQDVATAQCLLSWSWFNRVGNREMYQNCAVVNIVGSNASKKTKRRELKREVDDDYEYVDDGEDYEYNDATASTADAQAALSSLPDMYVANLKGINGCSTQETVDVVFDDPGNDVVYAKDVKPRLRFAQRAKVEACAGVGREAAGGTVSSLPTPVSSSYSAASSIPTGDDGQWHGGGSNNASPDGSSRTSASKAGCNLSDGMWHPDCFSNQGGSNQKPIPSDATESVGETDTVSADTLSSTSSSNDDIVSSTSAAAPTDGAQLEDSDDLEDYHATIAGSKHSKPSTIYSGYDKDDESDENDDYYDYGFYRQALRTRQSPEDGSEEPTAVPDADLTIPPDEIAPFEVVSNGTSTWMEIEHGSTVITQPIPLESDVYDSDGHLLVGLDPFAEDGEEGYIFPEPLTTPGSQTTAPSTTRGSELPAETSGVANDSVFNQDDGLVGYDPLLDTEGSAVPGPLAAIPPEISSLAELFDLPGAEDEDVEDESEGSPIVVTVIEQGLTTKVPLSYSPTETSPADSEAYDKDGYPKLPENWLKKNPHHTLDSGASTTVDALRDVADGASCHSHLEDDTIAKRSLGGPLSVKRAQPNVEIPEDVITDILSALSPKQIWKAKKLVDTARSSSLTAQQADEAKTLVDDFAAKSNSLSKDQISKVKGFIDGYVAPLALSNKLRRRETLTNFLANLPIPRSNDELEFLKAVFADYAVSHNPEKALDQNFVKTLFKDRNTTVKRSLGKRQGSSPWSLPSMDAEPKDDQEVYSTQSSTSQPASSPEEDPTGEDNSEGYGPDDDSSAPTDNASPYNYYEPPPNLPPYAYSYDEDGQPDGFAILLDTPTGGLSDDVAKQYLEHSPKEDDYPDVISEWWPEYKGDDDDSEGESGPSSATGDWQYDDSKDDRDKEPPKGGWKRSRHVARKHKPTSTSEETYPYSPYPDFNPVPSVISETPEPTPTSDWSDSDSESDSSSDEYPGPYNYYNPPKNLPPYAYSYDENGQPDGYAILLDTPTGGLPEPYNHSPKEGDYPDEIKDWQDAQGESGDGSTDPGDDDGSGEYKRLLLAKRQDFQAYAGDGVDAFTTSDLASTGYLSNSETPSESSPSDSWYDDLTQDVERPGIETTTEPAAEGDDWFSSLAPELNDAPQELDTDYTDGLPDSSEYAGSRAGDGVDELNTGDLADLFDSEERKRSTRKRQNTGSWGGDGLAFSKTLSDLFPDLGEDDENTDDGETVKSEDGCDGIDALESNPWEADPSDDTDTASPDTGFNSDVIPPEISQLFYGDADTDAPSTNEDDATEYYRTKRQEDESLESQGGDGIEYDPEALFPSLSESYGADGNGGDTPDVDTSTVTGTNVTSIAEESSDSADSITDAPDESEDTTEYYHKAKRQEIDFPSVEGGDGIDSDPETMFPDLLSTYGADGDGGDAIDEAAASVGDDSTESSSQDTQDTEDTGDIEDTDDDSTTSGNDDTNVTSEGSAPTNATSTAISEDDTTTDTSYEDSGDEAEWRLKKRQELNFPSVEGGDGIDYDAEDMFPGMQDQDAEGWVPPTQIPGAYSSTSNKPATHPTKKPATKLASVATEDDDAAPVDADAVESSQLPKAHISHSKKPVTETLSDGSEDTSEAVASLFPGLTDSGAEDLGEFNPNEATKGADPFAAALALKAFKNKTSSSLSSSIAWSAPSFSSSSSISTPTSIWSESVPAAFSSSAVPTSTWVAPEAILTPVLATDVFWAVSLLPKPTAAVAPARIADPVDSLEDAQLVSPTLTNTTSTIDDTTRGSADSDWGVEGVDWTWDYGDDGTNAVDGTSTATPSIPTLPLAFPPSRPSDAFTDGAIPTGLAGLPAPTGPVEPLVTGFGEAALPLPTGEAPPIEPTIPGFGKAAPSVFTGNSIPVGLSSGLGESGLPLPTELPSSILPYIFGPGPVVPFGKSFSMPIPAGLKHRPTGIPADIPGLPIIPTPQVPKSTRPIAGQEATATSTILTTIETTFTTTARETFTTTPRPLAPSAELGALLSSMRSGHSASRASAQLAGVEGHSTTSRRLPLPTAEGSGFRNTTSSWARVPASIISRSSIDLEPPVLGATRIPTGSASVITTPLVNPLRATATESSISTPTSGASIPAFSFPSASATTLSTLSTPSLATDVFWAVTSTSSLSGPSSISSIPTPAASVFRRSAHFDPNAYITGEDVKDIVRPGEHAEECQGGGPVVNVVGIMRGSSRASDVREGVEEPEELKMKT